MKKIDFSKFYQPQLEHKPINAPKIINSSEILNSVRIDLTRNYPEVNFLLEQNAIGCLSKGDIQAIKAKAKQGKTHAIICLEVALLKGSFVGLTAISDNIRILHIDTEQNPLNVSKNARKVHRLCRWDETKNNDRFIALALREYNTEKRCSIIEDAIREYNPDIVFIDGVRDLLRDFNSIEESAQIMNLLLRLSKQYDVALCCVLHENKADGNMRGHLGTELVNKCSETYKVQKDKFGTISVEQSESRNAPINDWAFILDENGIPKVAEPEHKLSQTEAKEQRIKENMQFLFQKNKEYQHAELVKEYMEISGIKERTACEHISNALKKSLINKKINGKYELNFT
ncbi:MAG: AAA family ATPase [Prevotellaceae bacterium]|jgi:hypothetical protein|nr:AAA family ATPase [Prevotellaceae bacterium]